MKSDFYLTSQLKAEQMTGHARRDAGQTKLDADFYVVETLSKLEAEMNRILAQVRNGIKTHQAEDQNTPPEGTD